MSLGNFTCEVAHSVDTRLAVYICVRGPAQGLRRTGHSLSNRTSTSTRFGTSLHNKCMHVYIMYSTMYLLFLLLLRVVCLLTWLAGQITRRIRELSLATFPTLYWLRWMTVTRGDSTTRVNSHSARHRKDNHAERYISIIAVMRNASHCAVWRCILLPLFLP